jgi:Nuclease A inhibitor-like protein
LYKFENKFRTTKLFNQINIVKNIKNISKDPILEPIEDKIESPQSEMMLNFNVILDNLYYMSETDSLINVEISAKTDLVEIKNDIVSQYKKAIVQELNWKDFFLNKTEIQDWHDDFMKDLTQKMIDLKYNLENNFKTIIYLKIGKIEIDAFLIAQKENLETVVFKTKIVET